jgi:hypothetical protein
VVGKVSIHHLAILLPKPKIDREASENLQEKIRFQQYYHNLEKMRKAKARKARRHTRIWPFKFYKPKCLNRSSALYDPFSPFSLFWPNIYFCWPNFVKRGNHLIVSSTMESITFPA